MRSRIIGIAVLIALVGIFIYMEIIKDLFRLH